MAISKVTGKRIAKMLTKVNENEMKTEVNFKF